MEDKLKKLVESLQTIEFKVEDDKSKYTLQFDGKMYGDFIVVEGMEVNDLYIEVLNLQLKQLGGLLEALID